MFFIVSVYMVFLYDDLDTDLNYMIFIFNFTIFMKYICTHQQYELTIYNILQRYLILNIDF